MKITIEALHNTEYKKQGGKFVAVQKEVTRKEVVEIIGEKMYYSQLAEAKDFGFSWLSNKEYIVRFTK